MYRCSGTRPLALITCQLTPEAATNAPLRPSQEEDVPEPGEAVCAGRPPGCRPGGQAGEATVGLRADAASGAAAAARAAGERERERERERES